MRRFLNNPDLLGGMLARFRPDQERLLHDLARQIEQQDADGVRSTLHTIKGSAGTMGARAMARLLAVSAAQLEAAVKC